MEYSVWQYESGERMNMWEKESGREEKRKYLWPKAFFHIPMNIFCQQDVEQKSADDIFEQMELEKHEPGISVLLPGKAWCLTEWETDTHNKLMWKVWPCAKKSFAS